jgi:hypothetical protein
LNSPSYACGGAVSLIDPDGLMEAAPGRGPYPLGQGSGIVPGVASVGAVRNFLRNYQDMRDANTIGPITSTVKFKQVEPPRIYRRY